MPLLSVLIPTYNRPEYLQQALSSLVYLGKDIEVIIGNNGDSGPVNAAIAKSNIDKPISHLRNPAGSTYPDNLKILISKASGKWLTILHDDDFFTQESELIP
jgi:glycosyltransferase involved in cell wall biosynthesis